jgi:hypothetical protein
MQVNKLLPSRFTKCKPLPGLPAAQLQRSLLSYLRAGRISVHEAATIAGVSRIAVHKWCRRAGIRPKEARHREFLRIQAKIRGEVWRAKGTPRRGQRGKGRWVCRGKDELVTG